MGRQIFIGALFFIGLSMLNALLPIDINSLVNAVIIIYLIENEQKNKTSL